MYLFYVLTNGSLTSQKLDSGNWSPFPLLNTGDPATPNITNTSRSLAVNWASNEKLFAVTQRPGNGATLLSLSLQNDSWTWSDYTSGLTRSNSSFGFSAPFAATTNASTEESWAVTYMDTGKTYPWVGAFSNQHGDVPSTNMIGISYDGSSFRSSMYLSMFMINIAYV